MPLALTIAHIESQPEIDDAREVLAEYLVSMGNAEAIHQSLGFSYVDAPADCPDRFKPVVAFMKRDLKRAT